MEPTEEDVAKIESPQVRIHMECNEVPSILAEIDGLLVDYDLTMALEKKAQITEYIVQNGSNTAHQSNLLLNSTVKTNDGNDDHSLQSSSDSIIK